MCVHVLENFIIHNYMKLTFEDFNNFYNSNVKFKNTQQTYQILDLTKRNIYCRFSNDKFELRFTIDTYADERENYIKLGDKIILLQDIESFDKLKRIIESRL